MRTEWISKNIYSLVLICPQPSVLVTDFPMQHFLYFLPLPQGHGSLRPICGMSLGSGQGEEVRSPAGGGRTVLREKAGSG